MPTTTQVLVVGGSLNGLTCALLLARQGIGCTVVERHADTTVQYKFRGISPRSMEIFRGAGVEDDIRRNRTGDQKSGEIARGRTLADPDLRFLGMPWADTRDLGAAEAATCDQDRLEPILRAHASRGGADVRFRTEVVGFRQDATGVVARLRERRSEAQEEVRAAFLVAADGVNGTTREALGIGRHGPGILQHWMNLIFDTDLEPTVRGRPLTAAFVTDVNGSLVPRGRRWLLALPYDPAHERPEDFDAERTRERVGRAAGREVRADLVDARAWEVSAYVADRFSSGRTFLVGDAAHTMPPTGGFGGNTGIHDAHDLAWKLAAVLRGRAGERLLETYDEERRPIAEATLAQALARLSAWFRDPSQALPPPVPIVDDLDVIFGQVYRAGALVPEPELPDVRFEDPRTPSGRPGSRAPHLTVREDDGRELALHDAIGTGFLLVAGADEPGWRRAAEELRIHVVQPADEAAFERLDHVGPTGAVLVRPDGVVAWRSADAAPEPGRALARAMDVVLRRETVPA